MEIFGFILVGLAGGIASGLLGIGGGVIMIPALVFIFGFTQTMAQGTTLMLMIPPIGLLAAWEYYRNGHVNLKAAIFIAIAFFIGGFLGGKIALKLPPDILTKIFAIFLIIIGIKMFFK